MFGVEIIPDEDRLYYRIHESQVQIYDNGASEIMPHAFRERGEGNEKSMSTDWDKYSDPEILKQRAREPEKNMIVSLNVGFLREETLLVEHAPLLDNQAHTDVKSGEKKIKSNEIRLKLLDEASIEIEF